MCYVPAQTHNGFLLACRLNSPIRFVDSSSQPLQHRGLFTPVYTLTSQTPTHCPLKADVLLKLALVPTPIQYLAPTRKATRNVTDTLLHSTMEQWRHVTGQHTLLFPHVLHVFEVGYFNNLPGLMSRNKGLAAPR